MNALIIMALVILAVGGVVGAAILFFEQALIEQLSLITHYLQRIWTQT
jgi:cbb3-type cytochrome oxidase cytochrome c subunit